MRIRQRRRRSRAGFTVIEVTIALAILCSTVAVAGGRFLTNLSAVRSAQRTSAAALYLDTVMQDLSAQPYDSLLTFDGNSFHDQDTVERSNFRVQLSVFQAAAASSASSRR